MSMFDKHKITHIHIHTPMHSHVRTCVMWSPFPDEHLTHTYSCICFISNAGLNQEVSFGPVAPTLRGRLASVAMLQTVQSLNLVCLAGTALSGDSPGWMLTCSCRTTNSTSSLGRTDTASPWMLTCRPRGAVRGHCSCTGLCCRSTPPSHTLDTTFRYLGG